MSTQHVSTGIKNLKGNEILAMIQQTQEGTLVAVKPLCSALKIDWASQFVKLQNNPRFNCCDITMVGADGKPRTMTCLPAEQIPDWINSINSAKVAAEKAEALLELHKFFQYALNEFTRGRYVTQEEFSAARAEDKRTITELMNLVFSLQAQLTEALAENTALRRASAFRGSAGSYELHARKAEIKVKQH